MLVPVINLSFSTPQKRVECWIEGLYTSTNTLQRSFFSLPLLRSQIVWPKEKIDYTANTHTHINVFLFIKTNSV